MTFSPDSAATSSPTPRDYVEALQIFYDPSSGTVPFWIARSCAELIGLSVQFSEDYGHLEGEKIDLGEFNVWAIELM